jgi:hypothetical protein
MNLEDRNVAFLNFPGRGGSAQAAQALQDLGQDLVGVGVEGNPHLRA